MTLEDLLGPENLTIEISDTHAQILVEARETPEGYFLLKSGEVIYYLRDIQKTIETALEEARQLIPYLETAAAERGLKPEDRPLIVEVVDLDGKRELEGQIACYRPLDFKIELDLYLLMGWVRPRGTRELRACIPTRWELRQGQVIFTSWVKPFVSYDEGEISPYSGHVFTHEIVHAFYERIRPSIGIKVERSLGEEQVRQIVEQALFYAKKDGISVKYLEEFLHIVDERRDLSMKIIRQGWRPWK